MKAFGSMATALLLGACTLISPPAADPQVAVMMVNGSAAEVDWFVEQPNGVIDRLPMQACSAHSNAIDASRGWRVEVAGNVVASSGDVTILDAPVTNVRIDIGPDGEVTIDGPIAWDRIEDVPIRFPCATD
jgi:hypothetical protein